MNKKIYELFHNQVIILKAIANESRLAIIHRLYDSPANVSELVSIIGSDQSTVSRHLKVLKSAGIIKDFRKGRVIEYKLAIPCVIEFLSCATKIIENYE